MFIIRDICGELFRGGDGWVRRGWGCGGAVGWLYTWLAVLGASVPTGNVLREDKDSP